MRVAVTGTPGTGKTTATELLASDFEVIHLNEVIREQGLTTGHDDERDTRIADLDAVESWLDDRENVVVESHLAHEFDADRVIVLRCAPEVIERRLRERGESAESARENAESEALDVILGHAVQNHGEDNVYEIETTDRSPEAVAAEIDAVIAGEREPSAGTVDYTDYL
ncbi:adenylate kinase family protein [Halapricum hydrolyticum]|uniref:Putative adenylate kinase n=1 Tax=Halapricum hydrolyticum TaxID=2979991 RepID=A0AAE3IC76_9EURY|nr:adenylate kinase family protein [Halapricum hydrolyticum]MCU4716690.1 adenylate kinase family protein [Halapricum hydrolyticum]MCU4725705.1 adenylate kinase family protein [Halapricum hydrolyticum]